MGLKPSEPTRQVVDRVAFGRSKELDRFGEVAFDWRAIGPVDANGRDVVERAALQSDALSVGGELEAQLAPVVSLFDLRRPVLTRVNVETQGVPGPLVRILQLGAHWEDGAATHEQREGFKLGLVGDPTPTGEMAVGPEGIPDN